MSRRVALTLFSSSTCSLCTKAKDTILRVQKEIPMSLSVIDIHKPECPKEWADKYMFDIPVVHLDNQFLVQHVVPEDRLKKAIEHYQSTGEVRRI